jgi:hypothetical protein
MPLIAVLLLLKQWFVPHNYRELGFQLVIGGAVYGAGLLWAYFSNRALRTRDLVVKLEPGPNAPGVITEAVETYQGDV